MLFRIQYISSIDAAKRFLDTSALMYEIVKKENIVDMKQYLQLNKKIVKKQVEDIVKIHNGHIIMDLYYFTHVIDLSPQIIMYFKLKGKDIEIIYHDELCFLKINNLSLAGALFDDIITLNEYYMVIEDIQKRYDISQRRDNDDLIIFDNIKSCTNFTKFLENEYKIYTEIFLT